MQPEGRKEPRCAAWFHLEKAFLFPAERMKYIQFVRGWIAQEKAEIWERHLKGAGGKEISREHADLVDEIICRSYRAALQAHAKGRRDCCDPPLILVALGGYGRGELNLHSDVDILFVYSPEITPLMEEVIGEMLRFLWDVGLPVSHSCRSLENDLHPAELDLVSCTSLMESRYLIGEKRVFDGFVRFLREDLFEGGWKTFVRQKIRERDLRYAQYEKSANLLEPNIKEGPGGLRDFHTAVWLVRAQFQLDSSHRIWDQGFARAREKEDVLEAYDFLLRVRNEMHYACGKKNDILALQLQERISEGFGHGGSEFPRGVEQFMKDYYLRANAIRSFSGRVVERCREERETKKVPVQYNIDVEEDSLWLFKVFQRGQETGQLLDEGVRDRIYAHLSKIDENFLRNPDASRLFLTLLKGERAAGILREMHELGVLGRYIPEFSDITGLIQYDPSHSYTVEEHSLKGIEYLEELPFATQPELKELATLYQGLSHPEIVKLALLLHDVGKAHGLSQVDHIERGVYLVDRLLRRMAVSRKVREKVVALVGHHILMNHAAQRRDIHDKEVIRQFAETVGDEDTLQELYLLTYADIRAVGPNVWTVWKGALLWELYHKGLTFLTRGHQEDLTGEARMDRIKEEVIEELVDEIDSVMVEEYFEAMPYKYILSTTSDKIANHIRLIGRLKEGSKLALSVTHNFEMSCSELMVCTNDRSGIFSQIAGALTSKGINILGAQIFTRKDRIAIDTLQVASVEGTPLVEPKLWEEIERDLLDAIQGEKESEEPVVQGKRYLGFRSSTAPVVPTRVEINNRISDTHTVVEVFTQDRLGLLYDITCALYRLGIDIYIAKITTEVNKAIDVFYVTDLAGRKILVEEKLKQIREGLMEVLQMK